MRRRAGALILTIAAIAGLGAWWIADRQQPDVGDAEEIPRPPRIRPDYCGIVTPPNLAPLNFAVREEGRRYFARFQCGKGEPIEILSGSPEIAVPPRRWRRLLEANRGGTLLLDVFVQGDSRWRHYQTVANRIAEEEIDGCLVYRRVGPIHNRWRRTAVYQRDLTGFETAPLLESKSIRNGCVNCHSFPANDPERMLLGIRSGALGHGTLLAEGDSAAKYRTPFGYTAWHPSGRIAAYSVNKVRQFFHAAGPEVRDVIDVDAGLAYFLVDARQSKNVPRASDANRLATYPAWSPNGRYLYYSSAPFLWSDRNAWPPERYAEVKYDLMRIAYDIAADRWGEPELVLASAKTGQSILMPRISPDGKFLLFCMCRYGCFPALQPTSDLYLMRLPEGAYEKMPINSEFSEAYHSWSSNSRWIAFSSKRQGGFFTRCYLSYIDETGRAHKPFVVPQKDPAFYDSLIENICVPELVTGPVPVREATLARAARSPDAVPVDAPGSALPKGEALEPWQQSGR